MALYRKKPVVVEAFRLGIDLIPDWCVQKSVDREIRIYGDPIEADIKTLEGTMTANFGDFIIKGVKGEIYPCKADIFFATYEKAEIESLHASCTELAQVREKDESLGEKSDRYTPLRPSYNCQRGMVCPVCDKALWPRVEILGILGILGRKKIAIKEQPNFCKFCGQALDPRYNEYKFIPIRFKLSTFTYKSRRNLRSRRRRRYCSFSTFI